MEMLYEVVKVESGSDVSWSFQTQIRLHPMTESRSGIALQVGAKFGKGLGILTAMLIASGMYLEKGYEIGGRAKYVELEKRKQAEE